MSRSSSRERGVRERHLVGHALNRLIETEAGFDADDHQVERVGQAETDHVLTLLGDAARAHARQHVADAAGAERQHEVRRHQDRRREEGEHQQREADPDAEEDGQRLGRCDSRR